MAEKPPRSAPESIGSIGDITALASVSTPSLSLLCVGVAAQILIFDVRTGKQLAKTCWEEGMRIHGIRASKLEEEEIDDRSNGIDDADADADADGSTSSSSTTTFLLVAHGDRCAASYLLSVGESDRATTKVRIRETWRRTFGAWTLDAVPFTASSRSRPGEGGTVAVGEADGAVSLHRASSSPSSPSICKRYSASVSSSEILSSTYSA